MMRHIRKFHEKFVERLTSSSTETLRSCAWQLYTYLEENKKFKDAEFLKTMLGTIEFAIQQKSGTNWTIEKAQRDLRGRTRGVNQFAAKKEKNAPRKRIPITRDLARGLADVTKSG